MKRASDMLVVCIAVALGCVALITAIPRQFAEQEPTLRLVENVQALDALPAAATTYIAADITEDEAVVFEERGLQNIYRTTVNLRLRSEPSSEAEAIETISEGTMVLVTDHVDTEWYSVYVDDLHGYMSAEFLEFVAVRLPGVPMYAAGSVTIMDATTGHVLYEDEQDTLRYPASITKIITALLVLEHVDDLSELITFSHVAVDLPWYAGHISMKAGDTMSVSDALYALMLVSANEVARALAEHASGDIATFVDDMNRRAASLGAKNTNFINPCGLPGENQHTTSYDMSLIMREAIQHPMFNQIISTPLAHLPPSESHDDYRPMRNTNRLIRDEDPEFNEWVIGGKTGFTNDAQHTLVTYSEIDGRPVIISVLYVPQRGAIFSDTNALLKYVSSEL